MKKVRLFAVAAALGMFAATVNAAAPKVTKESYIGTWGDGESIVRAEIGGKVVLPSTPITVTKQTRTTDTKYAPNVSNTYGTGELKSKECYVGFTNTIGKDTNNDGIVDYPVLFWGVNEDGKTATTDEWYHDDAKFFPSVKTALYYMGMTSNGYGARFLAPNQTAKDGYIMIDKVTDEDGKQVNYHGWYDAKDSQKVIDVLVNSGEITLTYGEDNRGDQVLNGFVVSKKTTKVSADAAASTGATPAEKRRTLKETKVAYKATDINDRYVEDDVKAAILQYALNGTLTTELAAAFNHKNGQEFVSNYVYDDADVADLATYSVTPKDGATSGTLVDFDVDGADEDWGMVVLVKQDRYGKYEVVDAAKTTATSIDGTTVASATVEPFQFFKTFTDSIRVTPGKISVYEIDYRTDKVAAKIDASRISVVTPTAHGNAPAHTRVWDESKAGFVNKADVAVVGGPTTAGDGHILGLYRVDTPANNTDKYLIDFDMDGTGVQGLTYVARNTTKKYYTFEDVNGDEFDVPYVTIDRNDFPAFASEEAVLSFVERMAGIYQPSKSVFEAASLDEKLGGGKRTWLDGTVDAEYIPTNALDHYKAQQCTFNTGESTTVDASLVSITSNAAEIDTSKSGVHTVTINAKVGDEVVATKEVKVVIAPKYVREYKNGKVVSLKAYQLNGNLYSHATFDYAKKSSTTVFYAADGVTAIETVTNAIQ